MAEFRTETGAAIAIRRGSARTRLALNTPVACLAFLVAIAIALFPVFSHDFVSLNDVYNHVARAPVLAHYDDLPAYRTYWSPNWQLVPYLGFDVVSVGLLPWFSLGTIVRLMIAGTFVALLGGAMLL